MTTLAQTRRLSLGDRLRQGALGLDWVLLVTAVAISSFGLWVVKEATRDDITGDPGYFYFRQLVYLFAGLALMVLAAGVDLERIARRPWALWGALCAAVAFVLAVGTTARGSTRWIDLGPFRLQPSELGKLVLCVALAGIVVQHRDEIGSRRLSLMLTGATAVPAAIVFLQPDLGTSIVYFVILGAVLLVAGVPWTHFAAFAAVVAVGALLVLWVLPAAGTPVLRDYQVERLTAFATSDRGSTASYQLDQSKIAAGQGGALGKGVDGATQTRNDFLPEHHTDFIFSVVAEMFGFVGAAGLILAFGVLIWRGLRILARASTQLDQLVAGAIVSMLAFEVFVNIGMTVGIMPITGIPLPFMSYGGSHTLTNLVAVGLLLGIHRRRAPGPV